MGKIVALPRDSKGSRSRSTSTIELRKDQESRIQFPAPERVRKIPTKFMFTGLFTTPPSSRYTEKIQDGCIRLIYYNANGVGKKIICDYKVTSTTKNTQKRKEDGSQNKAGANLKDDTEVEIE